MTLWIYVLYLNSLFINFCEYVNNQIHDFKCKHFENKVLHLAIYNKKYNRFVEIYNRDNIFILFFYWIFGLSQHRLQDVRGLDFSIDEVMICSFVKEHQLFKIVTDKSVDFKVMSNLKRKPHDTKFIYCILDGTHDITHYFEDFIVSILMNKTLTCKCYVNALSHFYKKDIWMTPESELKLMLDNTYEEKVFKENDPLII